VRWKVASSSFAFLMRSAFYVSAKGCKFLENYYQSSQTAINSRLNCRYSIKLLLRFLTRNRRKNIVCIRSQNLVPLVPPIFLYFHFPPSEKF
jgi:hypothetical protein